MPVVNLQISFSKAPVMDAITSHALPTVPLQYQQPLSFPLVRTEVTAIEILGHVLRVVGTIRSIAHCNYVCEYMKREKSITFRVNDLEAEQIKANATARGKTVAEYLRWLVDRDDPQRLGEP